MDTMQDLLQKASVLNEALPYIRKFSGKTIVVKYGGSAMVEHELKKNVIRDVALLKLVGFRPIIVHGGGKEITKWTGKVGIETKFINGLRVTDKDTMEVAEMVLNKINKGLVSMMEKVGVKAVGISGKDGGLLKVKKKYSNGEDIGFVGEITEVGLLNKRDEQPISKSSVLAPPANEPSRRTKKPCISVKRSAWRSSYVKCPP